MFVLPYDCLIVTLAGYVQSSLFDGVTRFVGFNLDKINISVKVPANHAVMVSIQALDSYYNGEVCDKYGMELVDDTTGRLLLVICNKFAGDSNLLETRGFTVVYKSEQRLGNDFKGMRMRFSFHSNKALPQRLEDGTWNCSVPHWADFQQHLQCNLRVECASGEDEAQCPYTTDDCGPGRISIDGVCYVYVVPEEAVSWVEADNNCRLGNSRLASLETEEEWIRVTRFLTEFGGLSETNPLYIGLKLSVGQLPDM